MKLLMALDSRWANKAAVGVLDPHTGSWSSFEVMDLPERFNRRGFRGMSVVDGQTLYVVNSAALYRLRLNTEDPGKLVTVEQTIRRPEWEIGQRAAADLHHVFYDRDRDVLLVANSAMDALDEISPDGALLARRYLWDVSAEIAELALERSSEPSVHDLAHINHITKFDDQTYVTLGNLNGTRKGCMLRLETGEVVLDGLEFPHDGVFLDDSLYITNSGTTELVVWNDVGDANLRGRPPDVIIPIEIRQDTWRESFQWVRGIGATREHLIIGVTQWKNTDEEHPQIPPRLVFFERNTHRFEGEIFLPRVEGFPSPCVYSIHVLHEDRDETIPDDVWKRAIEAPPAPEAVDDAQIRTDEPADLTLLLVTARERAQRLAENLATQRAQAQDALNRSRRQNTVLRERWEKSRERSERLKEHNDRLRARLEATQARQAATQARLDTATARLHAIWRSRWWRLGRFVRLVLRRPLTLLRSPLHATKDVLRRPGDEPHATPTPSATAQASSAPLWAAPKQTAPVALRNRWLRGYATRPHSAKELVVASILDEMSHACFAPECTLFAIRPDNWQVLLEERRPHLLMVESAWKGNRGSWQYKVGTYAHPGSVGLPDLTALVTWCRTHDIPTVFWNKEDPVHFDRFKEAATLFDYVLTTDASSTERYAALPGLSAKTVDVLPFAAQPLLHNPIGAPEPRESKVCFAGTYYRTRHPYRRVELEMLLDAAIPFGLVIYDRTAGQDNDEFGFPERFRPYIAGSLPYDRMTEEYKRFRAFLNINSVNDSPTMLSRRVFELLGCGTPVVSTPSPALGRLFGDVVTTVETHDDVTAALEKLMHDDEHWQAVSKASVKTVMRHHTFGHRMTRIAQMAGYDVKADADTEITAIALLDDPDAINNVAAALPQTIRPNEVILGTAGTHVTDALGSSQLENVRVVEQSVTEPPAARLRQLARIAATPWVWPLQPGVRYAQDFLDSLLTCAAFAAADVIGHVDGVGHGFSGDVDPRLAIARRNVVATRGWPNGDDSTTVMREWFRDGIRFYAARP